MKLIGAASTVFTLVLAFVISGFGQATNAQQRAGRPEDHGDRQRHEDDGRTHRDGQAIFRFDTFGDEQLWTNVLRIHEPLATVDPATALAVGLKVDVEALPPAIIAALRAGRVDLTDPAVTTSLLQLNAVVGVKGKVNETGQLTSVGVTCALCHSTVDNSLARGIGRRLDGWANRDLNVGAIVALSPALPDALKAEFRTWGPGRYDPRHHAFDGTNLIPLNNPSLPIVIPSIYGLKGVGFETFTGDGPISYWNSYVGVGQMGGHGSFSDPRLGISITQTAGSRHPEARRTAGLSIEFACSRSAARQCGQGSGGARQAAVSPRGGMRDLPSVTELDRRPQRSRSKGAVPA